ncbi:MAG: alpha/beta hydrolase-fold protein [Candidatus Poribacteria bacterium]
MPEGYADSRRSYPAIYWIPGWETPASREYVGSLDEAIGDGKLPPIIVVSIDVREGLVLLNSTVFGRWEDFVVDELVPFIDGEYRTIPLLQGRALMGHSTGGYGAMMLPLLHPGIWSAVGLNDASVWGGCAAEMFGRREPVADEFRAIDLLSEYASLSGVTRARIQMGVAIAPDPETSLGFHYPDFSQSQLPKEWRDHCLQDHFTLFARHDALSALSTIVVGVADANAGTNYHPNIRMLTALRQAGIEALHLEMPGTHGGDRPRRFLRLAQAVTRVMNTGFPDPTVTTPAAWATIRQAGRP